MIRVTEIKMPLDHTLEMLQKAVLEKLRTTSSELLEWRIVKKSIDARKRDAIQIVYIVDLTVRNEAQLLKRLQNARKSLERAAARALEVSERLVGDADALRQLVNREVERQPPSPGALTQLQADFLGQCKREIDHFYT